MGKNKEKKKGGVFKKIIRIIILIILIPVLLAAGLYVNYLFTKEKPEDYLSSDFILYLEIESMGRVYENLVDLKALEVFLTGQQKNDLFLALNNFKSGNLARHPLFKDILDIKAYLQILDNGKPVIILDPGVRSILTRMLPLINNIYKMPEIDLNIRQVKGKTAYEFPLNDKSSIFMNFHKNLIFVGTDLDTVLEVPENNSKDEKLASLGNIGRIKKKVREKGFLTCYLQMSKLLPFLLGEDSKEWQFIDKQMLFPYMSVLTFDLSNEHLSLSFYSDIEYRSGILMDSLKKWKSGPLAAAKYFPAESTVFTAYRFTSFLDIYSMFLQIQEGAYDDILGKANSACKTLFGMELSRFLDWIGSEVGGFYVNNSTKPVLFMEIEDHDKLDQFIKKLTSSIFIKQEKDVLMNDEIKISQIGFPSFIHGIINHFIKGIEEPYYIVIGDYIFFCMDPEALYTVAKSYSDKNTITATESYQSITNDFPKKGSVFLYFDLSHNMPGFLLKQPQLMSFMDYYKKGLLTFQITDKEMHLEMSAVPEGERRTGLYPGYPAHLTGDVKGDVIFAGKRNSLPMIAYLSDDNYIRLADLKGKIIAETQLADKEVMISASNDGRYADRLYTLDQEGLLSVWNLDLEIKKPSPYGNISNRTFDPLIRGKDIYYYSLDDKTIYSVTMQNGAREAFPFTMTKPLHAPPAFAANAMAVYPKDLAGTVYLVNMAGEAYPGWPVRGGGVSADGPVIHVADGKFKVIFLTQAGILNVWDKEGIPFEGFPLDLDDVFYSRPLLLKFGAKFYFAVISERGVAQIITLDGKILAKSDLKGLHGKDISILAHDSEHDGNDELYFYGSRDYIIRTDVFLSVSSGFPVNGYTRPLFVDIDGDGKEEMASVGLDNKLYLYTLEN